MFAALIRPTHSDNAPRLLNPAGFCGKSWAFFFCSKGWVLGPKAWASTPGFRLKAE